MFTLFGSRNQKILNHINENSKLQTQFLCIIYSVSIIFHYVGTAQIDTVNNTLVDLCKFVYQCVCGERECMCVHALVYV